MKGIFSVNCQAIRTWQLIEEMCSTVFLQTLTTFWTNALFWVGMSYWITPHLFAVTLTGFWSRFITSLNCYWAEGIRGGCICFIISFWIYGYFYWLYTFFQNVNRYIIYVILVISEIMLYVIWKFLLILFLLSLLETNDWMS